MDRCKLHLPSLQRPILPHNFWKKPIPRWDQRLTHQLVPQTNPALPLQNTRLKNLLSIHVDT